MASTLSAQTAAKPPALFQKYCFECHSDSKGKPEGGISMEKLLGQPSVGPHSAQWEKVVEMLETSEMPPSDAEKFPTTAERTAAVSWVRSALKTYERDHAGEPGHVTVRRLTSGEYAYAIRDLTGIDIDAGIDSSGDSVGGEGFTNYGDVQFVQDASLERYLEAAKVVADHAVVGAGPLEFSPDSGKSGVELFALNRINELHTHGFRVVSGEGGRPFGLERYGKAFYTAWFFAHRAALGEPKVTLNELAAREGLTPTFTQHIWSVVNQPVLKYPVADMVSRWKAFPAPTADVAASLEKGRTAAAELQKYMMNWPVWFFGRGQLAAGGAGDESPLVFDDTSLRVIPSFQYAVQLGGLANRGGRGRGGQGGQGFQGQGAQGAVPAPQGAPAAEPAPSNVTKVFLTVENLNLTPGVKSVVIWRNPRIVVRGGAGGGGFGGGGFGFGGQGGGGGGRGGFGGRGRGAGAGGAGAAEAAAVAANPAGTPAAIAGGRVGGAGEAVAAATPAGGAGAEAAQAGNGFGNGGNANGNGRRGGRGGIAGGAAGPSQSLRDVLPPDVVERLGFGRSIDGSAMKPEDIAATGTISFDIPTQPGQTLEFQVDAELGADRNGVLKLIVTDRPDAPPARGAQARVFIGEPGSAGYKAFRAGIEEYLALLPPNSHGEANPADKDPVPLPFDSTYNTPEHDAFVLRVKYQRTDQFLAEKMLEDADQLKLEQAWSNLFDVFPYHDNYLGLLAEHYEYKLPARRIAELTPAQIAAMPAAMRPEVEKLRTEFAAVVKAQLDAEPGHVEDVLGFATRAWRRPLAAAEKDGLRAFYQRSRKEQHLDHDAAIKATIARVLVSPTFLYRMEPVAANQERPLTDWEMASRLSFFLWASIPDDELRRAAGAGELTKPDLLAKQVRRMTADPKARRLGAEFFGQWLGFYHFEDFRGVDTSRFPEFTTEIQAAMYDEAVSTFEYMVRQNRPMRELLQADYTFLNQPLAKFYGIEREVPSKDALTKVDAANTVNRGGALRLGAVLTVTSAPLRTSPVKRGDWVLRRILGTPTPPPPGNAGTLPADPKTFGDLTLREKLAEHKVNPTCAGCHVKIDPLGFPLEGFDAVGRPRLAYDDGKPVDTQGELADKRMISGADGLLKYLGEREPQVMRTLARKMIGYSLGRTVLASDRQLLDDMAATGGNASFADLAVKIATSRQFRHRAGDEAEPARSLVLTDASSAGRSQTTN